MTYNKNDGTCRALGTVNYKNYYTRSNMSVSMTVHYLLRLTLAPFKVAIRNTNHARHQQRSVSSTPIFRGVLGLDRPAPYPAPAMRGRHIPRTGFLLADIHLTKSSPTSAKTPHKSLPRPPFRPASLQRPHCLPNRPPTYHPRPHRRTNPPLRL